MPHNYSREEVSLATAIIRHGLKQDDPNKLANSEKDSVLSVSRSLLKAGHDPDELLDAARYGMRGVWPFDDGGAWDARDFKRNVSKAKAEARLLRESGNIPTKVSDL